MKKYNTKVLDILKSNALDSSNKLNEETDGTSIDGAFDYLVQELIEMTIPKTIASSVCSVQPLIKGPDGKAYGVKRTLDPITNEIKIKIASSKVHADYSERFKSDFTTEAIEDSAIHGTPVKDIFIQSSSAESSSYVDSVIIPVLRNLAKPMAPAVLDGNPETAYYQMLHNIHLALVDINRTTKRGLTGYAILSPTLAGLFAQFNEIYNDSNDVDTSKPRRDIYFLGSTDQVTYYMDPMAPSDDVIVGYNSEIEGETALVFCPYKFTIYKAIAPEDTNTWYHSLVRFGYLRNPLDNGTSNHDSDFLRIFALDASAVGDVSGAGAGNTLSTAINNYQRDDSVATAGQTTINSTGTGTVSRLFVDGVYIPDKKYTFVSPTLTLSTPLVGGEAISLETYDIV
jgi:hypothetical protein